MITQPAPWITDLFGKPLSVSSWRSPVTGAVTQKPQGPDTLKSRHSHLKT